MARLAVLLLCSLILAKSAARAPTNVSSFSELETASLGQYGVALMTTPVILFPYQLVVPESATFLLRSAANEKLWSFSPVKVTQEMASVCIPPCLFGGDFEARMFYLRTGSTLGLRDLSLIGGTGGAIYLSPGSELLLRSVRVLSQRALRGAAVYAVSSMIIATDCTMTSNSADIAGGAIYAAGNSTATMINCDMTSNRAGILRHGYEFDISEGAGGAIFASGNSIVETMFCTLTSNSASFGGAVYGGGDSTLTAHDCTMTSNSAHYGGAFGSRDDVTATITACTMISNNARALGGAVFADSASCVTLSNCTMTTNSALYGGAVYGGGDSTLTAHGCTVTSNSAYYGGAFGSRDDATATITACMMLSNTAQWSGGAFFADSASCVTVTSCTMTSNFADFWGGAAYATSSVTDSLTWFATITISDCSLISNSAEQGGAFAVWGESHVVAKNCTMTYNVAQQGGVFYAGARSTAMILGCTMSSNSALVGGVVAGKGCAVILSDCVATSNHADEVSLPCCMTTAPEYDDEMPSADHRLLSITTGRRTFSQTTCLGERQRGRRCTRRRMPSDWKYGQRTSCFGVALCVVCLRSFFCDTLTTTKKCNALYWLLSQSGGALSVANASRARIEESQIEYNRAMVCGFSSYASACERTFPRRHAEHRIRNALSLRRT